jgi:hypothetical protein
MMAQHRSQSALEFLSTYAFVFLLLAIVISLLFIFASLPRSLLPSQCTFYSGFTCMQAIYTINVTAGHGAELFIVAEDTQPGIVNVSNFSAYLNFHTSDAGSCAPSVATAGQRIYCIANFTATPTLANTYDGTFRMNADYCASGLNTISNESCRANSNFSYTGHITVQASKFNIGRTMLVPLTLTNSQNAAVPAHFDQMVNFSASKYLPYVNSNLGNIRFYYGSKELYSWCESSCNTSSTSNSIFWIRLPQAIPTNSVMPIEMYILPQSVDYTGKHAGEAPQWTCPDPANTASCSTYGKYDNGPSVFPNYWNFAGTSLPTSLSSLATSVIILNVNDGLTISNDGDAAVYTTNLYNNSILDAGVKSFVATTTSGQPGILSAIGSFGASCAASNYVCTGYRFGYNNWDTNLLQIAWSDNSGNSGAVPCSSASLSWTGGILTGIWRATGNESAYLSYGNHLSCSDATVALDSPVQYGFIYYSTSPSTSITTYWLRTRAYPPNGVMPSVSFGAIGPA